MCNRYSLPTGGNGGRRLWRCTRSRRTQPVQAAASQS